LIGPNVTIGPDCVIGEGVRIKNAVLMKEVKIGANSWINDSIIGWYTRIGKWVRIEGFSVLGEDVCIKDELFINGSSILPHKSIS
jgi:mannose-1-phosphate guanylyltransferase